MYADAVQQEKDWANYLFKDGSMIGLNDKLLHNFVEYMANKRMKAIGLDAIYDPIPTKSGNVIWTDHWLNSRSLQNAYKKQRLNLMLSVV